MFGYVWYTDYPRMLETMKKVDRRKLGLELLQPLYRLIWMMNEPVRMIQGLVGEMNETIKEALKVDKAWKFL